MKIVKKLVKASLVTVLMSGAAMAAPAVAAPAPATVATEAPGWSIGHVWRASFIKFRAGQRDKYLENLQKNYVRELEAAKKQGTIISYKVIQGEATRPDDWNVMILLELKDYAALGRFDAEMRTAVATAIGNRAEDEKGDAVRAEIRDYLGIKSAHEIIFKQ